MNLVDGDGIRQEPADEVPYYRLELDTHDVVLADGLPCESYLDTGNRADFANGGSVVRLHPQFALMAWEVSGCALPRVTGPEVRGSAPVWRHARRLPPSAVARVSKGAGRTA